ncbi:MAG: HNH endonuclease signature motif containing protein [Mycoplasma sp.]
MDKRFDDIVSLLDSFSELLGLRWFTRHGTSIDTYWEDWNYYYEYYKTLDEIDCKNQDETKKIFEYVMSNMDKNIPNEDYDLPGRYEQRITFWTLLGFLKRSSTYVYTLNEDVLKIDITNFSTFFINSGIDLIKKIKTNPKLKTLYRSSLKVFIGFYLSLLFFTLNDDQINYILKNINKKTQHQFFQILEKKNIDKEIFKSTYLEFINNYFEDYLSFDSIISLTTRIINLDKIKSEDYIVNELVPEQNNDFFDDCCKLFESDNTILKDATNSKLTKLLRDNFKKELNKDDSARLLINNKPTINTNLIEGAHIVPISEIKIIINNIMKSNISIFAKREQINNIHNKYCKETNGLLLPFNYHFLYDEGYISIDRDKKSFILTELGCENEYEILNIYGFTTNNKIEDKKFDSIIRVLEEYEKSYKK